jgi:hypothetical protein
MVYGVAIMIVWMAGEGIASRSGAGRRSLLANVGLAAVLSGCLTALGYWPVVQHSGFGAIAGNRFLESPAATVFSEQFRPWLGSLRDEIAWLLPEPVGILLAGGFGLALLGPPGPRPTRLPLAPVVLIVPPARVFSCLFPLIFCLAAAGLRWGVGRFPRLSSATPRIMATTALVLCLALGALDARAVKEHYEAPNQPIRVATALASRLRPGDLIAGNGLVVLPLIYQLRERGVPMPLPGGPWEMQLSGPLPPRPVVRRVLAYVRPEDDRALTSLRDKMMVVGRAEVESEPILWFGPHRVVELRLRGQGG